MTKYEKLVIEAEADGLIVREIPLAESFGRINGNRIAIRKGLPLNIKVGVLAEELGHYYTTVGNILDMDSECDDRQENRARIWAYNKAAALPDLIEAYIHGYREIRDIADFLEVSEEFLTDAIRYYANKFGHSSVVRNYTIYFYPSLHIEITNNRKSG